MSPFTKGTCPYRVDILAAVEVLLDSLCSDMSSTVGGCLLPFSLGFCLGQVDVCLCDVVSMPNNCC